MKSILDAREVRRAQVGPRELKEPRSREYAIQTLYALKRYLDAVQVDEGRVREELEKVEKYRHWEVLGYPSKDALLKAETGLDEQGIERKLDERRIGIPGGQAGPGRGKKTADNISRFSHGTQASYTLARLERDRPELAVRVRAGELSANAAAIEAGFRIKTFSVPLDVERAAAALKRVFTNSQLVRLRSLL